MKCTPSPSFQPYRHTNTSPSLPLPPRHLVRREMEPNPIHPPPSLHLNPSHDLLRGALVQRARPRKCARHWAITQLQQDHPSANGPTRNARLARRQGRPHLDRRRNHAFHQERRRHQQARERLGQHRAAGSPARAPATRRLSPQRVRLLRPAGVPARCCWPARRRSAHAGHTAR